MSAPTSSASRGRKGPTQLPRPQVPHLVALRWRMVRSAAKRRGLVALLLVLPTLMVTAIVLGRVIPRGDNVDGVLLITPSILLGFLVLSISAPLAAGGGLELYPPDQLVAFPIRPRTIYWGSLLLAPLNLAWLLQVVTALGLIAYVSQGSWVGSLSATITTLIYLAMVTVLGQAIAWVIVGVRQRRAGRIATWTLLIAFAAAVGYLAHIDRLTDVLDRSPTVWVVVTALAGDRADYPHWIARTGLLIAFAIAAVLAGRWSCAWSLRQPADRGAATESGRRPRRPSAPSAARELDRIGRRGVWRSAPLRRGTLLLGLLPGLIVAFARADWVTLTVLPGLVAAGAGLLFGVNAFCLDGTGSVWLASLPHTPATLFWSRTRTVAEVVTIAVGIALTAGALRAPHPADVTQLVAAIGAAAACIIRVTATCMNLSVRNPQKADLRGPRDTPAPPGTMASYSLRLAASCTGIGLTMGVVSLSGQVWLPLLFGLAFSAFALRTLARAASAWSDEEVRARVIATVAGG